MGLYLRCQTQWRLAPSGARIGLDYTGAEAAMRVWHPRASPGRKARLFRGLQVIEAAFLRVQYEDWKARAASDG